MAENNANLKYEQINWGWLNDYAGYKFAPITFYDNLYTEDGKSFKSELSKGEILVGRAKALATPNDNGTSTLISTNPVKPVYFNAGIPVECEEAIEINVIGNLTGNVNDDDSWSNKTVKAGTITGTDIDGTTITGTTFSGGTFSGSSVSATGIVSGNNITASNNITATETISGKNITASNNITATETVSGKNITVTNTVTAANATITGAVTTPKVTTSNTQLDLTISDGSGLRITSNATKSMDTTGKVGRAGSAKIYGAVWNDYAEFRNQEEDVLPGYCVCSSDNGKVSKTTEKFAACDGIVSDTYGFAIGDTAECRTPLAVAGRVLAYCGEDRNTFHAGDTVCAGPEGKV